MISYSQAEEIFETILCKLTELPKGDPQRIQTTHVLVSLAKAWPQPLNAHNRQDLEALCWKVAVAKQVQQVYELGWRNISDAEPLQASFWSLLIAIFLAYSHHEDEADEDARGLALKSLNAAFSALDIAKSLEEVPHLPTLRSRAQHILESMLEKVNP